MTDPACLRHWERDSTWRALSAPRRNRTVGAGRRRSKSAADRSAIADRAVAFCRGRGELGGRSLPRPYTGQRTLITAAAGGVGAARPDDRGRGDASQRGHLLSQCAATAFRARRCDRPRVGGDKTIACCAPTKGGRRRIPDPLALAGGVPAAAYGCAVDRQRLTAVRLTGSLTKGGGVMLGAHQSPWRSKNIQATSSTGPSRR